MAITINTMVTSMQIAHYLDNANSGLAQSLVRLSSGLRINSAKDDAAGLAIANRLTSQINGLDVGMRNANDAMSVAQIAEGAMAEQTNMLQRMRDLTIQAENGSLSSADISSLTKELNALSDEINAIGEQTAFGDIKLLNGQFSGGRNFQVGHQAGQNIQLDIQSLTADVLGVSGLVLESAGGRSISLMRIDTAIKTIDSQRADLGAVQNRLEYNIANSALTQLNVATARSRIMDVDFAKESANLLKYQVMQQIATTMLAQANQLPQLVLSLLK